MAELLEPAVARAEAQRFVSLCDSNPEDIYHERNAIDPDGDDLYDSLAMTHRLGGTVIYLPGLACDRDAQDRLRDMQDV